MKNRQNVSVLVYATNDGFTVLDKHPKLPAEYGFYADDLPDTPAGFGLWLFEGTCSRFAGEHPVGSWRRLGDQEVMRVASIGEMVTTA